jgi:transposase
MGETRRRFSREFKVEAVRLVTEEGRRDLDISPSVLRRWRQQLDADPGGAFGHGQAVTDADELTRLRRELAQVRQERDFLKKAAAFFAKESR